MTTTEKIRVHTLAKELGIPSTDLINFCHEVGVDVKSHSSSLDAETAALLKKEFKRRGRIHPGDKTSVTGVPGSGKEPHPETHPKKPTVETSGEKKGMSRESTSVSEPSTMPSGIAGEGNGLPGESGTSATMAIVSKKIEITNAPTIQILAQKLNVRPNELIKKAMSHGIMATINQRLNEEMVFLLAADYDAEVEFVTQEEDESLLKSQQDSKDAGYLEPRGPVVTIMGHVDHGKTSLLDSIRKTSVAAGEFGGITQHIGAYDVKVNDREVIFLDTPGHEAFTAMRARGAKVTDIVVLVVSAVDGVMPQTIEAIHHAQAAKVPILVAVNKVDLPDANVMRIKQQLSEHGLLPEDWGGKTIFVEVSAKKKIGLEHLLEMLLLEAEVLELKANPRLPASGTVVEAKLDRGRGPVATVLVDEGTLRLGDPFVAGLAHGKVRAMFNDQGKAVVSAGPAKPVEVLGFSAVPEAGDKFIVTRNEKIAKEVTYKRQMQKREEELVSRKHITLDELSQKIASGEVKELGIIIKGDVQGSIEALAESLLKLSTEEVKLKVIHSGVGAITESDVLLATASDAIIIGFNVRPETKAAEIAKKEGVDIRLYRVIYDAVNEIKAAMAGLLAPQIKENVLGRVQVRQLFKTPKIGNIAGCYVTSGKIVRTAKCRLLRDNQVVYEGTFGSVRRFKDDVKEVAEGFECGITLENFNDIKEGDIIEAYSLEEIAREL